MASSFDAPLIVKTGVTEPDTTAGRRASQRGKVHTTSTCLYTDQIRALYEVAYAQDRSAADCLREALDEWLARQGGECQ